MIQLQDFVTETLRQIVVGVKTAQEFAEEHGAEINPKGLNFMTDQVGPKLWNDRTGIFAQIVKFDVAVTTTEQKTTQGGVGIFVGPVGLGSKGESDASNQSVSHIQFEIPILLSPQTS